MSSVNKAILIGNLGKDPEFKVTAGGQSVTTFSIATSEKYTDKTGQKQTKTEWHNIVAWGKLAEIANQYLKKGRSVYIEGRIETRTWDDKDGKKHYKTEINVRDMQFLGGPQSEGSSSSSSMGEPDAYSMESSPPAPMVSEPRTTGTPAPAEDDLPF